MWKLSLAVCLGLTTMSCAPTGLANNPFVGAQWPRSDQAMSQAQRTEIEALLKKLGYFSGTVDGVITRKTRASVGAFKSDIGVPVSGVISQVLLDALRANAGTRTVAPKPVYKPTPKRATPWQGDSGGGGGSGGPWG